MYRALLAVIVSTCAVAQQSPSATPEVVPNLVDAATATSHLQKKVDPVYPAIAQAAHVIGDVVLRLTIDEQGKVASVKVVSGPPMLRQAAVDAARQWQYTPFQLNGAAAAIVTDIKLVFELPNAKGIKEGNHIAEAFFPLESQCRQLLQAQKYDEATPACNQAVQTAKQFPPGTRTNEQRDAWQLYGVSLLHQKKFQEALTAFDQEVAIGNQSLHKTDAELGYAYRDRAVAYASLGDIPHALSDFTTAEEILRAAMAQLPALKSEYSKSLSRTLQTHASVLRQTGQAAEADKLDAEAKALE